MTKTEYNTEYVSKRRAARRTQGFCWQCGNTPAPGRKLCPACVEYYRALRQTPEAKARDRAYLQTDEYKVRNRERQSTTAAKAYHRAYAKSPKVRARQRAYNESPKGRAYFRAYYKTPKVRARQRAYAKSPKGRANNLVQVHNRKARMLGNGGKHTAMEWAAVKALAGNRCLCCGRSHTVHSNGRRGLTRDHVVASKNGGTNDVWQLQPLCSRCNPSKGAHHHTDYRPAGWHAALKRLLAGERAEPFKIERLRELR